MIATISPGDVRVRLLLREETALIDLREEEPFAAAHPLFAAQMSAGRIEVEAGVRIPRKDCCIILYDDGEGLIERAAESFTKLGYSDVRALEGGLAGWRAAGYELFQDVNSYSKAFGELVEHRRHTPSLPAEEVKALIEAGANIRIMDARRFEEYATMNIPSGTSVPGAELVLRGPSLAPDPDTTIIVNCAGRTRSIIGTQSLVNARLPNRVFALRNGTIGWTLAGQELEQRQERRAAMPDEGARETARQRAREVAYRAGVRHVTRDEAAALAARPGRTLYRFDVRDPAEYRAGHLPGYGSAPGGQLVQETDMFAPVRGAAIVLADDIGPRADMTASWLAQMSWEVYVLKRGFDEPLERGAPRGALPPLPSVPGITPQALADLQAAGGVTLIDLASSREYRRNHIAGARFALRVDLAAIVGGMAGPGQLVLTSPDGALAAFAAQELASCRPLVLDGGTDRWITEGRPTENGFEGAISPSRDHYKRPYEGTDNAAAAMQAYLDWEYGLVDQLARDGTHGFVVI